MLLVVGVLAALWEAQRSGQGQVVDAAMVDGASLLVADVLGRSSGTRLWVDERERQPARRRARRSTTPTPAPTAGTSRSARSSRSSTPRCSPGSASTDADAAGAARPRALAGSCGSGSPPCSPPAPATSGRPCSRAPTRASRRCWRSARWRRTRTSRRGARSSSADGIAQAAPAPRFSRTPADDARAAGGAGAGGAVLADWAREAPGHETTHAAAHRGARVRLGVCGSDGSGVVDQQVAGAVRVDRDARARGGGHRDLLDVAALGGGGLARRISSSAAP